MEILNIQATVSRYHKLDPGVFNLVRRGGVPSIVYTEGLKLVQPRNNMFMYALPVHMLDEQNITNRNSRT